MRACSSPMGSPWSVKQDKLFEAALLAAYVEGGCEPSWEKMVVPGKDLQDVKRHYEMLVEDIRRIESGIIALPSYSSQSPCSSDGLTAATEGLVACESPTSRKNASFSASSSRISSSSGVSKGTKSSEQERRKGIPWTEDEHRLFLLGLDRYGKGDWRSISRNFVVSRTPTQVASHAQKYYIRLNSINKDKRRTSIHDITNVGDHLTKSPITGAQQDQQQQQQEQQQHHHQQQQQQQSCGIFQQPPMLNASSMFLQSSSSLPLPPYNPPPHFPRHVVMPNTMQQHHSHHQHHHHHHHHHRQLPQHH